MLAVNMFVMVVFVVWLYEFVNIPGAITLKLVGLRTVSEVAEPGP